ncbi:MAG TPA: DUF5107 domain-containing protein [Verrucomicrobiae bacterium]|nr:DUF5107 domain-containing protein [Verrucomicrobiae bacterium]
MDGGAKAVRAWEEEVVLPTYEPSAPDRNPMFLERRVYQGSSGRVYPLPFIDRIAEEKVPRRWRAVWLENEYLRVMILPEIGGRIHRMVDKTNGYDLIYYQSVIKPALVGLAGPWISGGIEFNWPQHHRPATFMPVDFQIERHGDGAATVWCSDHDPMARMKGMHGVCLHQGRAIVELKVRAYNRTPHVQTFLWWANVATRVHEAYQSFFPPDVRYVADHARRATSAYPLCRGRYYGVDYGGRARRGVPLSERPARFIPPHSGSKDGNRTAKAMPGSAGTGPSIFQSGNGEGAPMYAPNDLSWYANIPVPTSYMCMGSAEDFFGGYDHAAGAGIIHIANHHISPGKKQWTWGNHEFGYAWDRNLSDDEGPYIEIMAGVYTDNQPDFSFLMPGETKSWSQYWYPIRGTGPAQAANLNGAASLNVGSARIRVGVSVTSECVGAKVRLERPGGATMEWDADLAPGRPFLVECPQPKKRWPNTGVTLRVLDRTGKEILSHESKKRAAGRVPPGAEEPPSPRAVASADELYLIGLHLAQYRHATRCPTHYWREALRRDPGDARCNNAVGAWHLRRGEFLEAEGYLRAAIARLTARNANPYNGEPYYNLGLCLRYLIDLAPASREDGSCDLFDEAYAAFYKATWNNAWRAAGFHALAEMDSVRHEWAKALDHIECALRMNTENLRARNLMALVLRKLGRDAEARQAIEEALAIDPLDAWARHLAGDGFPCDLQTAIDVAVDCGRAGFFSEAVALLEGALVARAGSRDARDLGAIPMAHYAMGWFRERAGDGVGASASFRDARAQPTDYCFPSRLEEIAILEAAIRADPADPRARYYLGCLLYDRRRHREAIGAWERAARLGPTFPTVWRNLGIGYFNVMRRPARARMAYERAFRADPTDARVLYERDQLWKRLGERPDRRLGELMRYPGLIERRDDLSIELCALYNQVGRHGDAAKLLEGGRFQPWEGGEGLALGQHVRTRLALGRKALESGDAAAARGHFEAALHPPANLGEARHLLANCSDIRYWLGVAHEGLGDRAAARKEWGLAAESVGDFQDMSVRTFSELTYFSALACGRLGRGDRMRRLLRDLLAHARGLAVAEAKTDYFATSLPTMLLFDDDLRRRQATAALFLQAQAQMGLGRQGEARRLLRRVLAIDPNHGMAADLLMGMAGSVVGSRIGRSCGPRERRWLAGSAALQNHSSCVVAPPHRRTGWLAGTKSGGCKITEGRGRTGNGLTRRRRRR